jgi:hypothetical protein
MVFVRLPLFNKRLEECSTLQDKLIFSLRHAHELEVKPKEFEEGVFDKIFDIAQIARFNMEERAVYEASMINKRDQYAILKCASDEGEARGEARGVAVGREKGIAKAREELFALLESGMSLAEAKKKLGLQK